MANGHGGPREGAGRPKRSDKFKPQIAKAEKRIADKLPSLIDNMLHLANGGYERVKEKFELAKKRDEKGRIVYDDNEEPVMEMVCVERTVEIADKDRQANQYLIDRILGKPTELLEIEQNVSGKIEVDDKAAKAAAAKLDEWRKEQNQKLNSLSNEPPSTPVNSQPAPPT